MEEEESVVLGITCSNALSDRCINSVGGDGPEVAGTIGSFAAINVIGIRWLLVPACPYYYRNVGEVATSRR